MPDTPATRLLQQYGVRDRATIRRFAAAALQDIERAERRRAALGYSEGLIGRILDDGGVIWGRCGHRGDTSRLPASHDDDAGYAKYTGGALGKYITTGLEDPPPDGDPLPSTTAPADDPELAKYRGRGMPV